MTSNSIRETAKIYEFPAGGRGALSGHFKTVTSASELMAARLAKASVAFVAGGECWYHEEAVHETKPAPAQ